MIGRLRQRKRSSGGWRPWDSSSKGPYSDEKKNSGTMIIKVRGTRLALGKRITGGIEVKEEDGIMSTGAENDHGLLYRKSQLWKDHAF